MTVSGSKGDEMRHGDGEALLCFLRALDEKIATITAELREARKREALERVEAEFAGDAA